MFMYHEGHPFQYIAIVSLIYAIASTLWATFLGNRLIGVRRLISIVVLLPLVIIFASFFGGMLWSWHDMQAGFIPVYWFRKLISQGILGLNVGWFVILLSFPYNLFGIIVGVWTTNMIQVKLGEHVPPEGRREARRP